MRLARVGGTISEPTSGLNLSRVLKEEEARTVPMCKVVGLRGVRERTERLRESHIS